ncbi:MAG: hypothetical protein JXQ90_05955 [Cyclobacteriaceae bacterium]
MNFSKYGYWKMGFMIVFFISIAAGIVMLLWNALIPDITGWTSITYLQAIGLLVLCKILFSGGNWSKKNRPHKKSEWMSEMKNAWQNMSPEDKEAMRQKWNCGPTKKQDSTEESA